MTNKITHTSIKEGDRFKTRVNGWLEVIEYKTNVDVTVRFDETGFTTKTRSQLIRQGIVKDRLRPSVLGVGFHGVGKHKCNKGSKIYNCWESMLTRCYSGKYYERHPTYKGCSVCDEWRNYQVFAEWYLKNYPDDGREYHLDKDIKVKGNKLYSPSTCMFVSPEENIREGSEYRRREVSFYHKDGRKITISNQSKFCKENGLFRENLNAMINGRRKSCGPYKMERAK